MSSTRQVAQNVFARIPTVSGPEGHIPFKRKLTWTLTIVALYFALTNVPIWGLSQSTAGSDFFGQFRSLLAGAQGSLLQLGIGPIVTASIVLQLLSGADLLGLDLDDPRDQTFYQGLQKFLVFVMVFITGIPIVMSSGFLPPSAQLASTLGLPIIGIRLLILAQIAFGGIMIYYFDEIISKWGLGSGIGLFIIAGVSQRLIGGLIEQIIPSWYGIITGSIPVSLNSDGISTIVFGSGELLAITTTVLIFLIVVYAESTRIEIPLSNSRVKGARGRFPVKLIYASVMPLILVRAVQANIQFIGRTLDSQIQNLPEWIAVYSNQQPVSGLFYYISPIQSPDQWMWWVGGITATPTDILIRLAIDLSWMVLGGAIFAVFWVETTGMGSESSAKQIKNSGLQIPGFRQNTSVIEKVMDRYIPYVTVIGGALVGFLALLANLLGTVGGVTGTGLLLAVSITYKLYEEIAEEKMMEMNDRMRQIFS